MSGALHLELLSERDLALLGAAAGEPGPDEERAARLRAAPERIEELLGRATVYQAFFRAPGRQALARSTPFLAFAILVARATQDLGAATFVEEWVGPGRRLPVFDIGPLREFAADAHRRFFLVDLLASFTRVASGSVWVRTRRGWRRQRYSELDPVRLAELLEVVPEVERPAVYRRLGDTALFLAGVFPDHAGRGLLTSRQLARLQRLLADRTPVPRDTALAAMGAETIAALEWLGRRSYTLAQERWLEPELGARSLLADVAERFSDARRILNMLTDRYLFPLRERWFAA